MEASGSLKPLDRWLKVFCPLCRRSLIAWGFCSIPTKSSTGGLSLWRCVPACPSLVAAECGALTERVVPDGAQVCYEVSSFLSLPPSTPTQVLISQCTSSRSLAPAYDIEWLPTVHWCPICIPDRPSKRLPGYLSHLPSSCSSSRPRHMPRRSSTPCKAHRSQPRPSRCSVSVVALVSFRHRVLRLGRICSTRVSDNDPQKFVVADGLVTALQR